MRIVERKIEYKSECRGEEGRGLWDKETETDVTE